MRFTTLFVALAVTLLVCTTATAEPTITIYTDADTYQSGDTIEVSLSAQSDDQAMSVAVYVGIILPDGDIWSTQYDGWSHSIEPWIPDIFVPAWFEMEPTTFWTFDLPCGAPPIEEAGDYSFAAVLTYSGTSDWMSELSLAPFSYEAGPSADIPMVCIPAGSFLMGSPVGEAGRFSDEGPQRTVNISAFEMSETEVTEKQWEDVVGCNDCSSKCGDSYPVENVTWFDCVSFCNELSEIHGYTKCYAITNIGYSGNHIISADVTCNFEANGFRLPTEAEWEYACRGGTTTRFYTGDSDSDLARAGWYDCSQKHEVAQKQGNGLGLYDTHGNVWEWCWDWYDEGYYGTQPDPDSDPAGPGSGATRVLRGGGWGSSALYCRSACRSWDEPSYLITYYGLRVCSSIR